MPLDFYTLRQANIARLPEFKNKHGEPAHSKADGSDWSPAQWLEAVVGELGEYANKHKKFVRGDFTKGEFDKEAADELADVLIYLDLLAFQLGIDLGKATIKKWNEVSARVGTNLRIAQSGASFYRERISRVGNKDTDCRDCKYCGMDMDMDPFCVHPSVLKTNQYGSNVSVVRGAQLGDERVKLPHYGLCGLNAVLFEKRDRPR